MRKLNGRVSASRVAIIKAMGLSDSNKGLTSSDSDENNEPLIDLAEEKYRGFVLCAGENAEAKLCHFSDRKDVQSFYAIPFTSQCAYSLGQHCERLRLEECLVVYGYKYMLISMNLNNEPLPRNVTACAFCGVSGNILGDAIVMK